MKKDLNITNDIKTNYTINTAGAKLTTNYFNCYKFELDETQIKELQEWMDAIKKLYGGYGHYEFKFMQTGIGCHVEVYSQLAKKSIDLSHEEKW